MTHVILAFHRFHPWLNPHHVAIVHGDQVIEASGFGRPTGVRLRSLYDYLNEHPTTELRTVHHADPEAVWQKCLSQVGKPYDWRWYIGMLSGSRKWQDDSAWTCHELIVWALGFNWRTTWIRPVHLYAFSEAE
jgi:uncharacterized protein YycO